VWEMMEGKKRTMKRGFIHLWIGTTYVLSDVRFELSIEMPTETRIFTCGRSMKILETLQAHDA
jgi:hypothetical protein